MIRNASHEDLEAVLSIENSCFSRPWSRKSFESELFKANGDFLVFESNGEVAGYIVFWYIIDEAELADIAVSDKFRRKGIAGRLIAHCIEKHHRIAVVHLEVEKDNFAAVKLYEGMGFIKNGEIKDYYGEGRHALRMSCRRRDYRGDRYA